MIALIMRGIGIGMGFVATIADAFRLTKYDNGIDFNFPYGKLEVTFNQFFLLREASFAKESETSDLEVLVSGIISSTIALGLFIGPVIAGILCDLCGFRWTSVFILGGFILLVSSMFTSKYGESFRFLEAFSFQITVDCGNFIRCSDQVR